MVYNYNKNILQSTQNKALIVKKKKQNLNLNNYLIIQNKLQIKKIFLLSFNKNNYSSFARKIKTFLRILEAIDYAFAWQGLPASSNNLSEYIEGGVTKIIIKKILFTLKK